MWPHTSPKKAGVWKIWSHSNSRPNCFYSLLYMNDVVFKRSYYIIEGYNFLTIQDHVVLTFQISIFMTHMTNYAGDRLAPYIFKKLTKFFQRWTNLKLLSLPPRELAEIYFESFPEEVTPLWQVSKRVVRSLTHLCPLNNLCENLPLLQFPHARLNIKI